MKKLHLCSLSFTGKPHKETELTTELGFAGGETEGLRQAQFCCHFALGVGLEMTLLKGALLLGPGGMPSTDPLKEFCAHRTACVHLARSSGMPLV